MNTRRRRAVEGWVERLRRCGYCICRVEKLHPVREFHFHPERKWRFDFAFPGKKIAVEIEGGVWSAGRHNRGSGFIADIEKYNAASILGWRVLRYATEMVESGQAIAEVLEALQ